MRTPIAYGYARASSENQHARKSAGVQVCDSVDRQMEASKSYWEYNLQREGIAWGGFEVETEAVSAYNVKFISRPGAIKLLAKLQPGDHILFDKVDRMWRRVHDFADVDRLFNERKITMHIVNLMGASIRRGTPMGDFIVNIMVAIAQMESQVIGDRVRKSNQWKKERGLPPCGKDAPHGFKIQKTAHGRVMQPDLAQLAYMKQIAALRDSGLSWAKTAIEIERQYCADIGKPYYPPKFISSTDNGDRYRWTRRACRRAYDAWKAMEARGEAS